MPKNKLGQIIEGLLFSAGRTLNLEDLREIMHRTTDEEPATKKEIESAIEDLNSEYEARDSAVRIHLWANGYRMASVSEVAEYVRTLHEEPPRRLSRSLLETLSVIAYRQPATKPEIDSVRGVDSNYALRKLMELGFVALTGRADTVGRPLLFSTTDLFLERFGLGSLDDLPKLKEAEDLLKEGELLPLPEEDDFEESPEDETNDQPAEETEKKGADERAD